MKKLKIYILLLIIFLTAGCFKRDNLEGVNIVTTVYPIEYVTNYLYGKHAVISSIYPDGVDTDTYKLSKKQIEDYSKKKLFIYNGLSNDKETTFKFLDNNKDLLIIDASYGMNKNYDNSELWLNPSNLLMMAQNIKNGLIEYISNSYLEKDIEKKYDELKLKLSQLDAEIKLIAENSENKIIVVNSDALKILEKYGFTVISLDDSNEKVSDKVKKEVESLINNNVIKHIFLLERKQNTESCNEVIDNTNVETLTLKKLDSISDEDRDELKNYLTLMKDNIELIKKELYEKE